MDIAILSQAGESGLNYNLPVDDARLITGTTETVLGAVELEDAGNLRVNNPTAWHTGLAALEKILERSTKYVDSLGENVFYLKFSTIEKALNALIRLQTEWTAQANHFSAIFLRLRIVLDTPNLDEKSATTNFPTSAQLERLKRLLSYAQSDQVIFSGNLYEQAQSKLLSGFVLRDLGRRLVSSDKVFLEHIYELTTPQEKALKSSEPEKYNFYDDVFPSIPSEILIREQEVIELEHLLRHSGVRLVTIVGPAGSGKSRLALEVANRLAKPENLRDGFLFITLKDGEQNEGIYPELAAQLGINYNLANLEMKVLNHLQEKQALLVLDNLKASPLVNRHLMNILGHALDVTILVTASASLQLPWEHVYKLGGLNFSVSLTPEDFAEIRDDLNLAEASTSPLYYLKLLEQAANGLRSDRQQRWLDWLEEEYSTIRLILNNYSNQANVSPAELEMGLRMSAALCAFWEIRGYLAEGREILTALLNTSVSGLNTTSKNLSASYHHARSLALLAAGRLAYLQGSYSTAQTFFEEGLELQEGLGDSFGTVFSLIHIGNLALRQGDYPTAYYNLERARDSSRKLLDRWAEADALNSLGLCSWFQGKYSEAEVILNDSLELWNKLGDKKGAAMTNGNLGLVTCALGQFEKAAAHHAQSLELWQSLADRFGIAHALHNQGQLAFDTGKYRQARSLYQESLTMRRELGDLWGIARSLNSLGTLTAVDGQLEDARILLKESLFLRKEIGDRWGMVESLIALGSVALKENEVNEAYSSYLQGLYLACELETNYQIVRLLEGIAETEVAQDNLSDAVKFWAAATKLREEYNLPLNREATEKVENLRQTHRRLWNVGKSLSREDCIKLAVKLATATLDA